ncbi:MAG: hypothetical protein P0116_11230 [Candidatus Nitrosocosmicus sp.]|nr:hypothetical protein [Candidatus Nitrosocosmicus sp.]
MALNKYAVQSHITIEGFNKTSESWTRFSQCPHGLDGPLELTQFVCKIVIQPDIIKIRPVFESGWTSKEGEKALTVFEKFLIVKEPDEPEKSPILFDDKLVLQKVFSTHLTTSKMKFLGVGDILLIDEPRGLTYRLLNGTLVGPLLDSNLVGNSKLVGLESIKEHKMNKVYLSYFGTKMDIGKELDGKLNYSKCLCLYQFDLVDNKLIGPKPLLEISGHSLEKMNSLGSIKIGPQNNLFLVFSTEDIPPDPKSNSTLIKEKVGVPSNITEIIQFPLDKYNDNQSLVSSPNLTYYYSSRISNSSGIAFDPISDNLWVIGNNVLNGKESSNLWVIGNNVLNGNDLSNLSRDELIHKVTNTRIVDGFDINSEYDPVNGSIGSPQIILLFATGDYTLPEFTWNWPNGPDTIGFLNSSKLGNKYANTIFVSDPANKYIYNYELNENRTGLELDKSFELKMSRDTEDLASVIFASGLGAISDIQTGPDGFLYLLDDDGQIFRIVPKYK